MKKLIPLLFFLAACSTVNKHKTSSVVKTDSVSHVKVDSSVFKKKATTTVKKNNTVIKKQNNLTSEKETITVYDTVYLNGKQQIKYVIVKEKNADKSKTLTKFDTKDSTSLTDTQQTTLNKVADTKLIKSEKVKDKVVVTHKSPFRFLWWLLLLIPLAIWYYWKKIPSFLKFGL